MLRLFLKLACSGGVLTGACLTSISSLSVSTKKQEKEPLKNVETSFNIDSLEKIELFEKANGCVFGFIAAWNDKNVLTAREFLKKFPDGDWKTKVINGAQREKQMCKDKKQVALAHKTDFRYSSENFK